MQPRKCHNCGIFYLRNANFPALFSSVLGCVLQRQAGINPLPTCLQESSDFLRLRISLPRHCETTAGALTDFSR